MNRLIYPVQLRGALIEVLFPRLRKEMASSIGLTISVISLKSFVS